MFNLNEGLWSYIVINNGIGKNDWRYVLLTVSFAFIAMAAGYLLGSVNSAIIISKTLYGDDIRKHGSGNAGLTNMLRTYGKKAAGLTLLGDILKTVLAILIASVLGGFGYWRGISVSYTTCELPLNYMAGFFAVIGHILPIYYGFKGGKGVLCAGTMILLVNPVAGLCCWAVFIIIAICTRYISLSSCIACLMGPVFLRIFGGSGLEVLLVLFCALVVFFKHAENILRIINGSESRFTFNKSK